MMYNALREFRIRMREDERRRKQQQRREKNEQRRMLDDPSFHGISHLRKYPLDYPSSASYEEDEQLSLGVFAELSTPSTSGTGPGVDGRLSKDYRGPALPPIPARAGDS